MGGHYFATLLETDIHLIAFDRLVYRDIQLIALTLMTFSKACALELRMITTLIEMIKHHSNREQTLCIAMNHFATQVCHSRLKVTIRVVFVQASNVT